MRGREGREGWGRRRGDGEGVGEGAEGGVWREGWEGPTFYLSGLHHPASSWCHPHPGPGYLYPRAWATLVGHPARVSPSVTSDRVAAAPSGLALSPSSSLHRREGLSGP